MSPSPEQITYEVLKASEIDRFTYADIGEIGFQAFSHTIGQKVPPDLLRRFFGRTSQNDFNEFIKTRQNPNRRVGTGLNPNQSFHNPRVAIASQLGEILGFAFLVGNVSGPNRPVRTYKRMRHPEKYYEAIPLMAVDPHAQDEGIGTGLIAAAMQDTRGEGRGTSTYVWSSLPQGEDLVGWFEQRGYYREETQLVRPFGPTLEVVQTRLAGMVDDVAITCAFKHPREKF